MKLRKIDRNLKVISNVVWIKEEGIGGGGGVRKWSMESRKHAYKILIWKPEENASLGRRKRRYEHNNEIDILNNVMWECELDGCGSGKG